MTRKNFNTIHYMRIMACLFVVLIHVTATPVVALSPNSAQQYLFLFINQLSKPAVPIFLFISGFLLHHIYSDKKIQLLHFYKKRLPKLVGPYILWSIGYYLIYVKLGYYPINLRFIIDGLLWGSFIYHLYFMVILIQLYILYPLFHYINSKLGTTKLFVILLAIQLLLIKVPFEHRDRIFITYLSYFAFGMLLRDWYSKIAFEQIPPVLSGAFFGLIGILNALVYLNYQNGWFNLPSIVSSLIYVDLSLSAILVLFVFFESLDRHMTVNAISIREFKLERRLSLYSESTEFIYYAHPLVIIGSEYILNRIGILSISVRAIINFSMILILLIPMSLWLNSRKGKGV
ncbi:MAG: hypothetical protein BGO41_05295 [Clostridiales bacterium 38-18]|mgnify:CR=1 FL=1|nr:MAG: hypothetical protein BGO41_05295 [Clostridiales bacterium 38-18]